MCGNGERRANVYTDPSGNAAVKSAGYCSCWSLKYTSENQRMLPAPAAAERKRLVANFITSLLRTQKNASVAPHLLLTQPMKETLLSVSPISFRNDSKPSLSPSFTRVPSHRARHPLKPSGGELGTDGDHIRTLSTDTEKCVEMSSGMLSSGGLFFGRVFFGRVFFGIIFFFTPADFFAPPVLVSMGDGRWKVRDVEAGSQ